MYESPISMFTRTVAPKISETVDGMVLKAVIDAGINVDREELIKALAYDRNQYEKGFEDGKADAQKWISVKDRLPEKNELVLCIGAKGGMFIGEISFLNGETAYAYVPNARGGRYAKYWMPLAPVPPKEE